MVLDVKRYFFGKGKTQPHQSGRQITDRRVAQIPFYHPPPCLVEIRQSALTQGAYGYYRLLNDQTQKTGGLADTPPVPLIGNVRNLGDERENVIGYFTASGVSPMRYWLDRRSNTGTAPGLFVALNGREPNRQTGSPVRGRPPLAVCVSSTNRTPLKPEGWRE